MPASPLTALPIINKFKKRFDQLDELLSRFSVAADLLLRLWVANVFFKSALTKIQSFDTTIMLFSYEYQVPLISPVVAAYTGTAIELVVPVLLVIGLMTRVNALLLLAFNLIAALSYPDISDAGIQDHVIWGMVLFVIVTNNTNLARLDYYIEQFLNKRNSKR